jgi:nucleotide-binding universal stress UspA family protein
VYVRRVIVGVSGSPGSLTALREAAAMARTEDAVLTPVLAWVPPGGDLADRRFPNPQLRASWQQAAADRLSNAISLAIGGLPDDVAVSPQVVRGEPGEVLTGIATEPGDLLVIGTGRRGVARLLACNVSRYCLAHARCPVIAVPPSELAAHMHGLHGWRLLHRVQPEHADLDAR